MYRSCEKVKGMALNARNRANLHFLKMLVMPQALQHLCRAAQEVKDAYTQTFDAVRGISQDDVEH